MKKTVNFGKNRLRRGYTTGSCAAAAAKAAAIALITQRDCEAVKITSPKGEVILFEILKAQIDSGFALCSVRKFSGDDPDITNGAVICAKVSITDAEPCTIRITGGKGVGIVTKPGLEQPVGEYAINKTPRKMIAEECAGVCRKYGFGAGLLVEISVERGAELAKKTFNPRLGIEGGLSILGTSGIVEPMSRSAIVETIRAEISVLRASGAEAVVITVGNYADNFARENLRISESCFIKCGNFIGDALNMAVEAGFRSILLVGHIGKLVKLGIGIANTHSQYGDGRAETLAACAIEAGCDVKLAKELLDSTTADAMLELLKRASDADLLKNTMNALGARINNTIEKICGDASSRAGFICFYKTAEAYEECLRSRAACEITEVSHYERRD